MNALQKTYALQKSTRYKKMYALTKKVRVIKKTYMFQKWYALSKIVPVNKKGTRK